VFESNVILVVDDDPEMAGYYWEVLNENADSHLVTHWIGDFNEFEKMFGQMVADGKRYPLCIVDLTERRGSAANPKRGLETVQRIREKDKDIRIFIATHADHGLIGEVRDALAAKGQLDGVRFFRLHDLDREKFRKAVNGSVERSLRTRNVLDLARTHAEEVPISGLLKSLCEKFREQGAQIESSNVAAGISVRAHHGPLKTGLDSLLAHCVDGTAESSLVEVIGERSGSGAMVTLDYKGPENVPPTLASFLEADECAHSAELYVLDRYLRSAGGEVRLLHGVGRRGSRFEVVIRSFD
jgi:CheY-like chemotaxis protein